MTRMQLRMAVAAAVAGVTAALVWLCAEAWALETRSAAFLAGGVVLPMVLGVLVARGAVPRAGPINTGWCLRVAAGGLVVLVMSPAMWSMLGLTPGAVSGLGQLARLVIGSGLAVALAAVIERLLRRA